MRRFSDDLDFSLLEPDLGFRFEVDIDPPPKFTTEMKLVEMPRKCWVRAYDLPGPYAGKVSAALFRKWKNRAKGRDWYDVMWCVQNRVELDIAHLVERAKEGEPTVDVSTREKLLAAFDARIDTIDFENAKQDVRPYLKDSKEVDIWSREFFEEYIRRIIIKGEQP